jgi:hypothetical protein
MESQGHWSFETIVAGAHDFLDDSGLWIDRIGWDRRGEDRRVILGVESGSSSVLLASLAGYLHTYL